MITGQSYLHGLACARASRHMGVSVHLHGPTGAQNLGVGWHPSAGLSFPLRLSDHLSICSHPCVRGWPVCPLPSVFLGPRGSLFFPRMSGTSLRDWELGISTGVFPTA